MLHPVLDVPWQLVAAMLLNAVVQALSIAAYAARLAGARSRRTATAMSLYNIFVTVSRFSQMLYTPMLGALSDHTTPVTIGALEWQLRSIVFAGLVGAALGAIAVPTFVMLYVRGIWALERRGNVLRAASQAFKPATLASIAGHLRVVGVHRLTTLPYRGVPRDVLVLNTVVTAVYGIGVVAATYASVLYPALARTALLSSGLFTGIATIAYNIVVDPASAMMTDRAARGERNLDDVRALVVGLSATAVLGFALSQLLLIPGAYLIGLGARLIGSH